MKFSEKATSAVLSLLISLFTFLTVLSLIILNTFCDAEFMLDVLERHEYYDHIFDEYCVAVEDLAVPSGVPEGRFSAVMSKDELIFDINSTVTSAYSADDTFAGKAVDTAAVYDRFYTCLCDVAVESGFVINDDLIPGLENVAMLCTDCYKTYVTLPFIDTIGGYGVEFTAILQIAVLVFAVFLVFFIVLILMSKPFRKNAVGILAVSFNTVGFMLALAPAAVFASGKINYLNIAIRSLYNFAVGYCKSLLYIVLNCGVAFLILGFIFVILYFVFSAIFGKKNKPTKISV